MGLRGVLCAVNNGVGDWKFGGPWVGAACCVEYHSFLKIKGLSCNVVHECSCAVHKVCLEEVLFVSEGTGY